MDYAAICRENRAVTRTVPGLVGLVPGHRAALVSTGCGHGSPMAVSVSPYGDFSLPEVHNPTFACLDVITARDMRF